MTCLWLQPFYPSPDRDNGYDVSDYYDVDPKYGSLGDFVELMNHAESRERECARTPMQWTAERNGGFSTCEDARRLVRPVISDETFVMRYDWRGTSLLRVSSTYFT